VAQIPIFSIGCTLSSRGARRVMRQIVAWLTPNIRAVADDDLREDEPRQGVPLFLRGVVPPRVALSSMVASPSRRPRCPGSRMSMAASSCCR